MGSDFLFATPSFVEGMARVLDVSGSIENLTYSTSRTPSEADTRALQSDWSVVGQDLQEAAEEYWASER